MNYTTVLFDLDGTITDSAKGIINSVSYALTKMNLEVPEYENLTKYIGPPLLESFEVFNGLSKEASEQAVLYFREYYTETGILENVVYEGFESLLQSLQSLDITLVVATSKPEPFAKKILEHFSLSHYFKVIAGSTLNETRTTKDEVITYALESLKVNDPKNTIMVGDRKHDILGAKTNGLDSIGVLYGYGDLEELQTAGADYIVSSVTELKNLLKN